MKLEPLLYVPNIQKSIEFFRGTLGFQVGESYPNKENPTYVPVFIGENKLMLVSARDSNKKYWLDGLGGSGVQFFIQIDDVNKKWKEIKGKVSIIDGIETKSWWDREFTINGLDGYMFSFYSSR